MARADGRRGGNATRAAGALLLGALAAACRTGPATEAGSSPAPQRVTIGGVSWFVDYEAALAVAREQDKALWVHFGENPG